jgi:hypothetical protein
LADINYINIPGFIVTSLDVRKRVIAIREIFQLGGADGYLQRIMVRCPMQGDEPDLTLFQALVQTRSHDMLRTPSKQKIDVM